MRRTVAIAASVLIGSGCVVRTVTLKPLDNIAVRGFVAHAEREWPAAPSGAQTADTLDWLVLAVESLARSHAADVPDLAGRVRDVRALLSEFTAANAQSLERTRILRRAFAESAALISDLSAAVDAGDVDRAALRRAADALDPNQLPREQPDAIERYFQAASEALQHIDRAY